MCADAVNVPRVCAQETPAAAHFRTAMLGLLRRVLADPASLRWHPAVVAAATLAAARKAVGCHPLLPGCVQQLAQLSLEAVGEDGGEGAGLAAAVAAVEPLAAAAGLSPARPPLAPVAAARPPGAPAVRRWPAVWWWVRHAHVQQRRLRLQHTRQLWRWLQHAHGSCSIGGAAALCTAAAEAVCRCCRAAAPAPAPGSSPAARQQQPVVAVRAVLQ